MSTCLNCGNKIKNRNEKFCNNKCQKEYEYKQYIEKWKCGEESGIVGKYNLTRYIRRYLFEKYNNKCCLCGWGEKNTYLHTIPLEIDHIDGDYKNNREENLRILCPNCHALTSTYKGANKGNGREDRKKYYGNNKNTI